MMHYRPRRGRRQGEPPGRGRGVRSGQEDESFGLILVDQEMPGMDGEQAARVIKSVPRYRDVPLVLLSTTVVTNNRGGYSGQGDAQGGSPWPAPAPSSSRETSAT